MNQETSNGPAGRGLGAAPCSADTPPPSKTGWKHSEQVLVFYEGCPEAQIVSKFGVAYYHYDPPFENARWVDWDNPDRVPSWWWPLPSPPNDD